MATLKTLDLGGGNTAAASAQMKFIPPQPAQPKQPQAPQQQILSSATKAPAGTGGGVIATGNTTPVSVGGGDSGGASQGPSLLDMINEAYNQEQNYLGGLESTQQDQAARARTQVNEDLNTSNQILQNNQQQQLSELDAQKVQRGLQNQTATGQVKQLLSNLQDRMAAQLAATGGYGGSQAMAMGEAFGKQANQSLGNLQNNYQSVLDSIAQETGRVKTFFTNKMAEVKQQASRALNDIETQLSNQLSQIGQMKAQSAQAKAQATMQAWQNYANMKQQLNLQAQSYAQQLDAWRAQKEGALSQAQQFALSQIPNVDANSAKFDPSQAFQTGGVGQQQAPTAPIVSNTKARIAMARPSDEQQQLQNLGILPSSIAF